jgi:hypothetical protein
MRGGCPEDSVGNPSMRCAIGSIVFPFEFVQRLVTAILSKRCGLAMTLGFRRLSVHLRWAQHFAQRLDS